MDCLFCKIIRGDIPASLVYQDESVVAFNDIHPQAPFHQLIVPKKHIATLNDLSVQDELLLGKMTLAAKHLAKELNMDQEGYRLVLNCNEGAGQTVFHIHMHLLAGRPLSWPPG